MKTIIMFNKPQKGGSPRGVGTATKYAIEVIGTDPLKDEVRQSIRELKVHPSSSRRSLLDMLDIIDNHHLEIRHVEHEGEGNSETWLFVLQKR